MLYDKKHTGSPQTPHIWTFSIKNSLQKNFPLQNASKGQQGKIHTAQKLRLLTCHKGIVAISPEHVFHFHRIIQLFKLSYHNFVVAVLPDRVYRKALLL